MKLKKALTKVTALGVIALNTLIFSSKAIATPQEDFKAKYVDIINNPEKYSNEEMKKIIYSLREKLSKNELEEFLDFVRYDESIYNNRNPKLVNAGQNFCDLYKQIREDEEEKQRAEDEAEREKYLASLPPLEEDFVKIMEDIKDIMNDPEKFTEQYKRSVFGKFWETKNKYTKTNKEYKIQQMIALIETDYKKNMFKTLLSLKYLQKKPILLDFSDF